MKDWFPLTSYDFYAYLTAGMVTLAAFDHVFMDAVLASKTDWNFVDGVFWAAIAYLVGHIIAIPSSAILEQWLAKKVLRDPSALILGLQTSRWCERIVGTALGAREYQPFPQHYRNAIVTKVARLLNVAEGNVSAEAAFQCAFSHARSIPDSATRMDNFLNQYGLCRNVSLASFLAAAALIPMACRTGAPRDSALAIGASILAFGLFARFIKFYAAYTREVFRAFNKAVV